MWMHLATVVRTWHMLLHFSTLFKVWLWGLTRSFRLDCQCIISDPDLCFLHQLADFRLIDSAVLRHLAPPVNILHHISIWGQWSFFLSFFVNAVFSLCFVSLTSFYFPPKATKCGVRWAQHAPCEWEEKDGWNKKLCDHEWSKAI